VTDVEKFRLSLLTPDTRARAEGVIQRMIDRGFREPFVGDTIRTLSEQREAVRRGTTGRKQNLSWHLIKRAIDFRDRLPNGKRDPTTRNEAFFLALWKEATAVGLRNLGYKRDANGFPVKYYINGGKVWDPGHCEFRYPYKSLKEAIEKEAGFLLDDEPHVHDPDDVPDPEPDDTGKIVLPPSPFS
jgi:hypothetical protein